MKVCKKCLAEKSENEFYARQNGRLRTQCKGCWNLKAKSWKDRNKEHVAEMNRVRARKKYAEDRETHMEKSLRFRTNNPEKWKEVMRRSNRKRCEAMTEEIRLRNNQYCAAYRARNAEAVRERVISYRKRHPEKHACRQRARSALKLSAMPPWLTEDHKEKILSFYEEAARLSAETGTKYHVDHIHPLNGRGFNGLHVPWNLRVISAQENASKGNRLLGDSQ